MKQLTLPGLDHMADRVTPVVPPPAAEGESAGALPNEQLEGQLALFDDYVQLRRDLHQAVEAGEFERALELRQQLDATYVDAGTEAFDFLDELTGDLWRRSPREVLAVGREIGSDPCVPSSLAASVPRAVITRLVAQQGVEAVLADAPDALAAVLDALSPPPREPDDADVDTAERARARCLVRDALLAGRSLQPLDFRDADLRDLLAEDLSPPWLACLGVLRRLWPVAPRNGASDDGSDEIDHDDGDDDARAASFWRCLQVTEDHAAPREAVHAARKRMKRVNPALHAAYLKRLV